MLSPLVHLRMNLLCLQLWPPASHGPRLVRCIPLCQRQLWIQNQVRLTLNAAPRAKFRQLFAFDVLTDIVPPPCVTIQFAVLFQGGVCAPFRWVPSEYHRLVLFSFPGLLGVVSTCTNVLALIFVLWHISRVLQGGLPLADRLNGRRSRGLPLD